MRISDWSSDVCSSDLLTIRGRPPGEYIVNLHYYKTENKLPVPVNIYVAEVNPKLKVLNYSIVNLQQEGDEATADRTSVVEGKRVSVSVDLGGRRFIKNNSNNKITHGEQ